jgi:hypothetical protein
MLDKLVWGGGTFTNVIITNPSLIPKVMKNSKVTAFALLVFAITLFNVRFEVQQSTNGIFGYSVDVIIGNEAVAACTNTTTVPEPITTNCLTEWCSSKMCYCGCGWGNGTNCYTRKSCDAPIW